MPSDFADNLRALLRLMRSWSGAPIDGAGVLRRLNPDGTQPPLFWIFNSQREPERLAAALGPDQPLVYGRSLHMIVPPGPDRPEAVRDLAAYYAQALLSAVGKGPLWIGANCQGATIAMAIARRLNSTGPAVPALALINAQPSERLDLPTLLLYGANDPKNDPFRADAAAASRGFGHYTREVLPDVAHGGYFEHGTVERVAARIRAYFAGVSASSVVSAEASSATTG